MSITLILGGARSGKSALAQHLASLSGCDAVYVATMEPRDDEVRARIAAHRAERPDSWRTIEEPRDIVGALEREDVGGAFVVIDCLTLWVSNLLLEQFGETEAPEPATMTDAVDVISDRVHALTTWCAKHRGEVVLVSNEVGLGLVPPYPLGRSFRDALGTTNMIVAARADRVLQCTAGLVVDLKERGAVPIASFGQRPH